MDRSSFVRFVAAGLCTLPIRTVAQSGEVRVRRVALMVQGIVRPGERPGTFRRTMRELGYIEGENLVLVGRGAEGDSQRFSSLIRELIAAGPEVIVAETTPGALAAKRATATIPIVIVNVSDPVGSGLVDSLARPGGNVTGGSDFGMETGTKAIELLRAVVPNALRMGVLMSDNPVHQSQFELIRSEAHRISVPALAFRVVSVNDLDQAFSAMVAQKVNAFIPLGGAPFDGTAAQIERMVALAAKSRLPAVYQSRAPVEAGGLMSYGTNASARWKQAARYVDRILKGAKPADLPIQQPTDVELWINRKTAANLGIKIPRELEVRAEFVD